MKITKTNWWIIGGAGLGVISVVGYLIISKKNKKTNELQQQIQDSVGTGIRVNTTTGSSTKKEPNWNSPFDMNYIKDVQAWVAPKRIRILDDVTAKKYATIIKNAKGFFNDDEYAVRDVFKKLRSKTDVASLSKAYYIHHNKKDMWQHLNSFLSHSEMKEYVWKYINRLPNYQTL